MRAALKHMSASRPSVSELPSDGSSAISWTSCIAEWQSSRRIGSSSVDRCPSLKSR
jgi:hypothetical protein